MDYSILILNFNGAELLKSTIPHTLSVMKDCPLQGELIIVDNCSTDDSLNVIMNYKSEGLRWFSCRKNRVLVSYNAAAQVANGEVIILLNNDEWIDKQFISVIVKQFRDNNKDLFSVIPMSLDESNGEYQGGLIGLEFKYGHYWIVHDFMIDQRKRSHTVVIGCLGAYNREKFIEIGGFEPLLLPFYWEDADLSYRASKRGWKNKYIPEAITYHKNQATISRFNKSWINLINRRNKLLFFYLNCNDKDHWIHHSFKFPLFALKEFFCGRNDYIKAFVWCVLHWSRIYTRRKKRSANNCLPDSVLI
tara:strand:+ start:1340 stop:2254 length:915 start_codon:yes stop_codon:yes gene_type:complete